VDQADDLHTIRLRVRQLPDRREIAQLGLSLTSAAEILPTEYRVTDVLALDSATSYDVQIARTAPHDEARDYQVRFLRVDRAPEHLPQTIPLDQSITGEEIDYPQDEDRFVFQGREG